MRYVITMPRFGTMQVESEKGEQELRRALLSKYPHVRSEDLIIRTARPPREISDEEAAALDQVEEVDE